MGDNAASVHDEWIRLLNIGDEQAFENIYNEFWESLYAIAYNRLKSKTATEEVLQNLFADIWAQRAQIDIHCSLAIYLNAALKYKILNHIRFENQRKMFSEDHPGYVFKADTSTSDVLAFDQLMDSLQKGLEKLPEKCRLVFKLSREQQKSSKEIADELQISHRTVQTHIHKAIKFLKSELSDYKILVMILPNFI